MTSLRTSIGTSGLSLDVSQLNLTNEPSAFDVTNAWKRLKERFHSGESLFYDAVTRPELSQCKASQDLAQRFLESGEYTDCLFIGIGGSSLGPKSLLQGLAHLGNNSIRFHFLENPDALEWTRLKDSLRPESTLVCAVTKSGKTFETLSLLLLALAWIEKKRWKSHAVFITDPDEGELRELATQEGIASLPIHPAIGGRYSVFSSVGLFPLALAGLNANQFLAGAASVRSYFETQEPARNPFFQLGSALIQHAKTRPIHVCMPYSDSLKELAFWWVQLWAESLGKDRKGFTPVGACGPVDQHSILQLLRDGPDDKVIFFIQNELKEDPVQIPSLQEIQKGPFETLRLLSGHSLHELVNLEYNATCRVMTSQRRPHFTIHLDSLDEKALGSLTFALATLTAFTGVLWNLNPFDQPGVEEGKIYVREALEVDPPARTL